MTEDARAPLWLHSRPYDLFWYAALPVLLYVVMTGAAYALGDRGPVLVYLASSVTTGLTHNALTWLLILPKGSRGFYEPGALAWPFVLTGLVLVPVIVYYGTPAFAWALTLNILIAYFHITRQHQGLLHQCDGRYVQATGDQGFRAYSRDLRWLVGVVAAAAMAWKMAGPPMRLGLMEHPMDFMAYPAPREAAIALTAAAAFLAGRFGWRTLARHREGKRFPVVHFVLAGFAMANLVAAAAIPNDRFFLTLALVASYHNLQYFGFCYTHHHLRAVASGEEGLLAGFARQRKWAAWVALPVGAGLAFAGAVALLPPMAASIAATWFMTSHYFVDGNVWRRKFYPLMGKLGGGRVGAARPVPVPEPVAAA